MNFIVIGCLEISQKLQRLALGTRIFFTRKKLHRAEVRLGWLGWQQADFFGTELEPQIEKIQAFEKEQANLANISAEMAEEKRKIAEQRAAARTEFEATVSAILQERAPHEERFDELNAGISDKRETVRRFETARKGLEKSSDELIRLNAELNAIEPRTMEISTKLLGLADKRVHVSDEIGKLHTDQNRVAHQLTELETTLSATRIAIESSQEMERKTRREFEAADRVLAAKMNSCERAVRQSDKGMESLDAKKSAPFLLVGRSLADHEIAPINQPEALSEVHRIRTVIARAQLELDRSRSASAATNRAALIKFYALIAAVLAALFGLRWTLP